MDEYISKQDALEIVKRTCGDYAAAFAEISRLPADKLVEESYKEGHISGYYEGLNDGEKSRNHGIVMKKLEQITDKMDGLETQLIQLEQTVLLHTHTPINQPVYIQHSYPWWMEPGGYGGHGGGQG